jgi:hypothetical protein
MLYPLLRDNHHVHPTGITKSFIFLCCLAQKVAYYRYYHILQGKIVIFYLNDYKKKDN